MTKDKAKQILEDMPENKFQEFFQSLPLRTQSCIKGKIVNWQDVLPQWYIYNQLNYK